MIKVKVGDATEEKNCILAHQVNCKGVMGAGIAKQIKNKLFTAEEFNLYKKMCEEHNAEYLMGKVQTIQCDKFFPDVFVCNMFAENIPGANTKQGFPDTDYKALHTCLSKLFMAAELLEKRVVIPGLLGCGLAGGDWNYVLDEIIRPIFEHSDIELTIVYFLEENAIEYHRDFAE